MAWQRKLFGKGGATGACSSDAAIGRYRKAIAGFSSGLRPGEADVLIGGPPCQPILNGDSLRLDDLRADTLTAYLRVGLASAGDRGPDVEGSGAVGSVLVGGDVICGGDGRGCGSLVSR